MEKGADLSRTDTGGKTARDYLREKSHENILRRFDGDYFTQKVPFELVFLRLVRMVLLDCMN